MARPPLAAFAVDDRACQVVWRSLPTGSHRLTVGGAGVTVDVDDGPGAAWVDGLPADTILDVGLDGRRVSTARTRPALAGPVLSRIATVSDLHLGERTMGRLPSLSDPPNLRCLEAALEEIVAWGADLVVVKGDVTAEGRAREWAAAVAALAAPGLPVVITVGNHDVRGPERTDLRDVEAGPGLTFTPTGGVHTVDLPGLRVIVADSTTPGSSAGSSRAIKEAVTEAAEGAPGAVLVAMHHHLQPLPVAHHWPPGVPGHEAVRFTDGIDRAGRPTIVTSGHTHRHRARRYGRLWATEVGSVKDYPGVWAAYEAHPGGLRQTVHRVGAPDVLRWTDRTAKVALGAWGRWSPGHIDERCLEVTL